MEKIQRTQKQFISDNLTTMIVAFKELKFSSNALNFDLITQDYLESDLILIGLSKGHLLIVGI